MFDILKFGAYISKLRKSADMTQSELADRINLTRQAVSKYERGDSFPDISILLLIADVFGVTAESLIKAGEPTRNETELLLYQSTAGKIDFDEIKNIAPLLKPSVLDNLVEPLNKMGIDISHIAALSEYMNTKSVELLIRGVEINEIDPELIRRLIPVLSEESRLLIFEKIIDGKMDWRFIEVLMPYMEYIRPLVENAVLEGVLPLEMLR